MFRKITKVGIDTKKLSIADKLDMLYGVSPTLSASTIRPDTDDQTFMGRFGVILSHGEIESAHHMDAGSHALSHTSRTIIGSKKNTVEDVDYAVNRNHQGESKSYNELLVKNPEVGGGFMKVSSMKDRTRYEDEEKEIKELLNESLNNKGMALH